MRKLKRDMKHLGKFILLCFALLGAERGFAVVPVNFSASWSGAQIIPDNNAAGVAFTFNVPAGSPFLIADVAVDLTLAGGWNGDLYATLTHGSGFAVLLNRIGRTAGNPGGSGVSGLNLQLADHFLTDVHTVPGNPLTGQFAPDGRFTNPFTALDTDARSAMLGSFAGLDPSGDWTLFFADVAPLATATIQSWTVNIGVAVPEPGSATIVSLAFGFGCWRRSRRC